MQRLWALSWAQRMNLKKNKSQTGMQMSGKDCKHLQSQCLVPVERSAKTGASGISASTEQGQGSRGGTLPLPGALHQGQAGRKGSCCACPGWAVHAELAPARTGITPYPRAVTPSHCWEVGRSRAQRESSASLPAVLLLAGTSPSSCS